MALSIGLGTCSILGMAERKHVLSRRRTSEPARTRIREIADRARKAGDLKTWQRARAVGGYIEGRAAAAIAAELQVDRSAVFKWVADYAGRGLPALRPSKAPGPRPRLSAEQMQELGNLIEDGPAASGFTSGVWTARMIAELVWRRFMVVYSWKYVPELLHKLGFSVQRPRKRLARANLVLQQFWLRTRFPAIKKKLAATVAS
jgi:putative transposase